MLEENKKKILESNYYLNKRSDARKKTKFIAAKHRYFIISIILGLIILAALYFTSAKTNIFHIAISGNHYLKDEDIIKMSGLNLNDKFLLVSKNKTCKKLTDNPLIQSCQLEKRDGHLINIHVEEEKQIAYAFEDQKAVLILANDERIELDIDNMYLIENIPLIQGYNKEQLLQVIKGFQDVDYQVINEISEIHRYPFSYDENMLEVIMRDGNYVFVSSFGLKLLDNYYSIASGLDISYKNACIYLDEVTNSGYTSSCPWDNIIEEINEDNIEDDIAEE